MFSAWFTAPYLKPYPWKRTLMRLVFDAYFSCWVSARAETTTSNPLRKHHIINSKINVNNIPAVYFEYPGTIEIT